MDPESTRRPILNVPSKVSLTKSLGKIRVNGTINNTGKKVGRNDPCPCGSGRKYKKCCLNGNRPTLRRERVPPRPKSAQGSHPFIPVNEPQFEQKATVDAMRNAGVREEVIYAFLRTGRFISPEARAVYDEQTLAEWDAAIEEWKNDHGQTDNQPDEVAPPTSEDADARD